MKRLAAGLLITVLSLLAASSASAAPVWKLDMMDGPTRFAPGGVGVYWVNVANVGSTASSGPVTMTLRLRKGLTRKSVTDFGAKAKWSCPGAKGDSTIVCTTKDSISRHTVERPLVIAVDVASDAPELRVVSAKIEGGGADDVSETLEPTQIGPEPVEFGVTAESFQPDFYAADEATEVRKAGSHPPLFVTPFNFNIRDDPSPESPLRKEPAGTVRNVQVDLPAGMIGNPSAVGECSPANFALSSCPFSSQVGRADLILDLGPLLGKLNGNTTFRSSVGIFNLSHPRGVISDLGFAVYGNPVHVKVSLDPANGYVITSKTSDINESAPASDVKITLWGVPADKSHDSERCSAFSSTGLGDTTSECSTDATPRPFLSLPSQCEKQSVFRMHHYDSWQNTGVFGPEISYALPDLITNCDEPRFEPEVEVEPTGKQANTPTGLDVHVKVKQNEVPDALATPPVKRATVTLPDGMSFSPSFADGLSSCTLAQMKLGTNEAVQCPDSSRIGEVALHSPLLPKSLEGSMYLAAQRDNPFGSTFALLLVLHDTEERGILVKIPGRIDVDPASGQIKTVFDDLPQFPFDDFVLKFRSGPRAPLVSPPSCGEQTIGIEIASYAQPQDPIDASNTYRVTEGPNGTPCPLAVSDRPFSPEFTAGTLNPVAGAFSPFLDRQSREDDEQEMTGVKVGLPPGLVAKIAGMSFCPEEALASISAAEFAGRAEQATPACPASSEFGSLSAGLGAGSGPNYFPGKAYLAGPYKGAPLSLAVVAPAIAGPFDLGNVVVRAALYIDPETTQVTAVSDPFPTILHGVILRTRDIRLRVDRPNTTLNPTNCSRMAINGEVSGIGGTVSKTAVPFQVGSCGDLDFKPKLDLRLFGGTKRGAHPKFQATFSMPPGGANAASASVALPRSEFLDQGHIKTICTRVQFAAEACPAGSIYGTVVAKTPLLDETLTGNVYLRSSSHELPDLVAAFRGGKIDANVVGRIDSVNGGIRNTFDLIPDVPVSKVTFTFAGGRKGLLVNSRNICAGTFRATAKFNGQNGDVKNWRPRMQAKCGKARKSAKRHKRQR